MSSRARLNLLVSGGPLPGAPVLFQCMGPSGGWHCDRFWPSPDVHSTHPPARIISLLQRTATREGRPIFIRLWIQHYLAMALRAYVFEAIFGVAIFVSS